MNESLKAEIIRYPTEACFVKNVSFDFLPPGVSKKWNSQQKWNKEQESKISQMVSKFMLVYDRITRGIFFHQSAVKFL